MTPKIRKSTLLREAAQKQPATAPAHKPDRYFSRAIGNALMILETLQASGAPLSLREVTRRTRLPKSSAFRILRTLQIVGYAQRVEGDRFRLGEKWLGFLPVKFAAAITDAAVAPMRQLGREFRESVSLAVLFDHHIEVTAVVDSPQHVRMGNVVGGVIPPHASSLGKCITAFQNDEDRDRLIRSYGMMRLTEKTITGELELQRELERVRTRGYAMDLEESALDGCCLAAPIVSPDGNVRAAVSLSMPKMRFSNRDRLIAAVCAAAAEIGKSLAQAAHAAGAEEA
jgi:DNA-binding IclR family transcriptional regulator